MNSCFPHKPSEVLERWRNLDAPKPEPTTQILTGLVLVVICSREDRWRPVTITEWTRETQPYTTSLMIAMRADGLYRLRKQGLIQIDLDPVHTITPTQALVGLLMKSS